MKIILSEEEIEEIYISSFVAGLETALDGVKKQLEPYGIILEKMYTQEELKQMARDHQNGQRN